MRRLLTALALVLALTALVAAQAKRVPIWPADFEYLGSTWLPSNTPSAAMVVQFSRGLVAKVEADGQLHVYTAAGASPGSPPGWTVNDFVVPVDATTQRYKGPAIYKRTLGQTGLPAYSGVDLWGLYYDRPTDRWYATGGEGYDARTIVFRSLVRARLDNGKFIPEGNWLFDRRTYPYTIPKVTFDAATNTWTAADSSSDGPFVMGGIVPVPDWWTQQFGGGRFMVGFGGIDSGFAGRSSYGPALATFDPPAAGTTNTPVVAKGVLGYPYANITTGIKRAPRDPNFVNDFSASGWVTTPTGVQHPNGGEDWPRTVTPPAPGFWLHADFMWQGGAWIESPTISGPLFVAWQCANRAWYGVNATPATDGSPAKLNCFGSKHVIYSYDPIDFGAVLFGGKRQDQVLPVAFSDFHFPGLTYPIGCTTWNTPPGCLQSLPMFQFMVTGVTFEPTSRIFAVMVWDQSSSGARPRIAFWRLRDVPVVLPSPVSDVTLTF